MKAIEIIKVARDFVDKHNVLMPRGEWVEHFSLSKVPPTEIEENGNDRDENHMFRTLGEEAVKELKVVQVHPKIDAREFGVVKGSVCSSATNTLQVVSNIIKKQISIGTAPVPSRIYGAFFGSDKSSSCERILLNLCVSRCWRRFSAVKELAHLLVYNTASGNETNNSNSLIEAARKARSVVLTKESADIDDEAAAIFIAMEILLPWCERDVLIKMHSDNSGVPSMNNRQIARAFAVPERMVDIFFERDLEGRNYCGLSFKINREQL